MTHNWDIQSRLEFESASFISDYQTTALRAHLDYISKHSPFYQRLFKEHGIAFSDIQTVDDLATIPFTCKSDLEDHNDDFLCVPHSEVRDLCQTSGTTGKPVVIMQTAADLERLAYNEAISFAGCGITSEDSVVIACSLGRNFMAGLAYYLGITKLGATAIRTGSDSLAMIMESIRRYRPTALVAVPSLALAMAKRFSANGEDPRGFGVKRIVCIGEPVRRPDFEYSPLGQQLHEAWGADLFGTYASTEMATAFCDCVAGCGGHLHPDLMVVEVVDDDGNPAADGESGEVIATPLGVTGMPLLRLKTGDICQKHVGSCACGRNSLRLGPVIGRRSQMLKIRGCTVYPPAIFTALQAFPEVTGSYIEVYDDFDLSDRIVVVAGSTNPDLDADAIAEAIAAATRVKPAVTVVTPEQVIEKTVDKDRRKPQRFFDYRQQTEH